MRPSLPPRLLAALVAVTDRLDLAGVEWLLAGSAARALAGFGVRPADLDIEISPHSDPAAPRALGLALRYADGGGRASWRALGTVAGAAVDLTSELEVEGPGGRLTPDFPLQRTWATWASVAGRRVPLAPVEETMARAIVRADWAALAKLGAEGARRADADADADAPGPSLRSAYLSLRLAAAARAAR